MKIRSFWIHNTPIGFKKIIAVTAFFTFCLFLSLYYSLLFLTQLTAAGYVLFITLVILLGFIKGITIVQKKFTTQGITHTIRDHIFPRQPQKSFRDLCVDKSNSISAALFLKNQAKWAYLDPFREIIAKNKPKKLSALVLGGGGAVIPLGLLTSFNMECDVVEISHTMISVAKQFFLPLQKNISKKRKKIIFIQGDAITHTINSKKKYGLAVVDLFNAETLLPSIKKQTFVNKLLKMSECTLVNFGILNQEKNLHHYFEIYTKTFPQVQIYLWRKNYLGIFSAKRKIKGKINGQRIY